MLKSLYTTATGMKAQQTMVDMIANNIANVNTTGFKKSQASFEDLLYVTQQAPGLARGTNEVPVLGTQIGSGTRLNGTSRVYSAGMLEQTERPLDVAIDGEGFFAVQLPDGTLGYTRDGTFQVNADGRVVTSQGFILQPEITLPQDALDIAIDASGSVRVATAGNPNASTNLGQLTIHRFVNPSGLLSVGGNVGRQTEASGPPQTSTPGLAGLGQLRQRYLERSNVSIVNELVNLIVAQRAYEVNSRAIQASDQMLSTATNIVR